MNKRIRKLAEQAGYKPLPGFDFANSLEETYLKKFAELIVQECSGVITSQDVDPAFKNRMAWAIKEHFGVES